MTSLEGAEFFQIGLMTRQLCNRFIFINVLIWLLKSRENQTSAVKVYLSYIFGNDQITNW